RLHFDRLVISEGTGGVTDAELVRLPHVRQLVLSGFQTLEGLRGRQDIEELDLRGYRKLPPEAFANHPPGLTALYLNPRCRLDEPQVTQLCELRSLRNLHLTGIEIAEDQLLRLRTRVENVHCIWHKSR